MPKSYSQFDYDDLKELGLQVGEKAFMHELNYTPIKASDYLKTTLERNLRRKLRSEKAKSEFLISPILAELEELNLQRFALYSGYKFNVLPKQGLNGFCDFVLSFEPTAFRIEAPIFYIVEAKNELLEGGIPQCVAELYAAQIFNERAGKPRPILYGAVTFGHEWKFIRFIGKEAEVDTSTFYLNQLDQILGIMQYIVDNA
jgi:hypothetical protein